MKKLKISKPVLFLFCFILIIFTIDYCSSLKIHILSNEAVLSTKKDKTRGKNTKIINNNSKFSKVCDKIFTTYQYMGDKALDVYEGCRDKFELLSKTDSEIIKEKPFCNDNIDQFFCNYSIENTKKGYKSEPCGNEEISKLILKIIQGCINENSDENESPTGNYSCSSLDYVNYKISDPKDFCMKAEIKELQAEKENSNAGSTYEYSAIRENERQECEYVAEMYNACIDADNLLFPFSDYKKCMSFYNPMYYCSKLVPYDLEEKDLCSNYVLPTLTYLSLQKNLYLQDIKLCDDFENKITNTYDLFSVSVENKISNKESIISEIDKIFEDNNNLSQFSHSLLNSTSMMNKKWLKFYPEFTSNFKLRKNLTEIEFEELSKLRTLFDEFFPYAANLNALTVDQQFIMANFTNLISTVNSYYEKAKIYVDELSDKIEIFDNLLIEDRNFTFHQDSPFTIANLMVTQTLNQEEITSFQNEFVEITLYLKKFMNTIMQKTKETHIKYTNEKKVIENDIEKIKIHSEKIKQQKGELIKQILS